MPLSVSQSGLGSDFPALRLFAFDSIPVSILEQSGRVFLPLDVQAEHQSDGRQSSTLAPPLHPL